MDSCRLSRARTERILLIDYAREPDRYVFHVTGQSGKTYEVSIAATKSCTCPDNRMRGSLCKHLIFVLTLVLGIPTDSPMLDVHTSDADLEDLLRRKPRINVVRGETDETEEPVATESTHSAGQPCRPKPIPRVPRGMPVSAASGASRTARSARTVRSARTSRSAKSPFDPTPDCRFPKGILRHVPIWGIDACPICFTPLFEDEKLEWCDRQCGNCFHADCMSLYKRAVGRKVTCPLCRIPWEGRE